ncbi:nitrate/nitrite transporter [Brachybacterium sp. p3-SID957]|uniref:MFS transporter n=1 Tax=Brachybacterium sp. p3-SID957 TaxID=2916049 RepID=UPI00223B572E|nr:MFS transporter [Brachybacterium sp. p3-SID957]MCT1776506.1 MFS transporter [Brachybacterium sp. p3-SID957]
MPIPRPRISRAQGIWAVGVLAYLSAVSGRASFGVASVEAAGRFDVGGAVLSLFGVVQLGTYAAAQIPAGLLLDRIGARRMLVLGAVTMAFGQLLLAFVLDLPNSLTARLLTGTGDAATLISVVRLIATWFPTGQGPVYTQLATMIGQFGQAVAAVPFFALLVHAGWTPAWVSLAFLLLLSVLLVVVAVHDEPASDEGTAPSPPTRPMQVLREVFASRSAWSGFFVHAMTLLTVNAFLFMWGVPYMTEGHVLSPAEVGTLLTVNVVVMMAIGPVVGVLTGRFPQRRALMGWTAGGIVTLVWAGTLLAPGPLTAWQLMPLMVALAIGSATCSVGFDLARTGISRRAIGTATGMANMGGYSMSLVAVLLIGILLDVVAPDRPAALDDYRIALSSMGALMLIAAAGLLATSRERPGAPR